MEKTLTEAAQLLQKISKGAAMRRDWEKQCPASSEEESQVRVLAGIFGKETSEVRKQQSKHGKVIETNHDEEASIRSATKDDPEKKGRNLGTAKSLREFEQMDWIPIDFGRLFDKARPRPNQQGMAKVKEEDFPPDNHTGYTFGKESAGDIIRKLFEKREEEIDLDEVLEIKRTLVVNMESSPYAHISQVYAI